jgi:zinc-ribbon domain
MSNGKMVTCANCGNQRPEGTRFCANCGTPFAAADEQLPPAELPPPTSSRRNKRLLWVAAGAAVVLLVAGGAGAVLLITGGGDSTPAGLDSITNTTDVFPTNDATTTGPTDATGQGVDQTCKDLVAFFALAKEVDIARGGHSVGDVEKLAAAASELASKAPAEPTGILLGEPRKSLEHIAKDYETYVSVLSEGGVDPGPDALLEPRISAALDDVSFQVATGLVLWMDARCSEEDKARLQQLGNG